MSFLVDDFFPSGLRNPSRSHHPYEPSSSALKIVENDDTIRLTMDLPGVRGKDLEVCVQHGVLCIRGSRVERGLDGRIRKKQRLSRRFAVDTDVVDITQATANIYNGVLVIGAPKKSKPTRFNIPVTEYDSTYVSDCEEDEGSYTYTTSSASSSSMMVPDYAVE